MRGFAEITLPVRGRVSVHSCPLPLIQILPPIQVNRGSTWVLRHRSLTWLGPRPVPSRGRVFNLTGQQPVQIKTTVKAPGWKENDSNRSQYCRCLRAVGVCLTSLLGARWHDCLESWERQPLSGDMPRLWCSCPRKQTQRCSQKHMIECYMHA